jgi:hypothetical protein
MSRPNKLYKSPEARVKPIEVSVGTVLRIDIDQLAAYKRLLEELPDTRVVYMKVSAEHLNIVEEGK